MVIADNLALIVDLIFSQANPSGPAAIIATYAFAFQIYCDFSGYTDIARGVARMLGFDLMLNFRLPYFATNPRDFWQRWHISLSSWLKDYLYISLGGNRISNWFTYRNLMITMLLAGLWHGASWNYVVWGLYHGLILCFFRFFSPGKKAKEVTFLKRYNIRFWLAVVFYFQITCLGWLIFRIQSLDQLTVILKTIITHTTLDGFFLRDTLRLLVLTAPLIVFQIYQHFKGLEPWSRWPVYLKSPFYCSLIYFLIVYGNPKPQNFIYFQF